MMVIRCPRCGMPERWRVKASGGSYTVQFYCGSITVVEPDGGAAAKSLCNGLACDAIVQARKQRNASERARMDAIKASFQRERRTLDELERVRKTCGPRASDGDAEAALALAEEAEAALAAERAQHADAREALRCWRNVSMAAQERARKAESIARGEVDRRHAYEAGEFAAKRGKGFADNPHTEGSPLYCEWSRGLAAEARAKIIREMERERIEWQERMRASWSHEREVSQLEREVLRDGVPEARVAREVRELIAKMPPGPVTIRVRVEPGLDVSRRAHLEVTEP